MLVELSSLVSGTSKLIELAPVVQKLDSAIHRINQYQTDNC